MEITYLSPALNHAVGGIKVIYKHSEILVTNGINSSVFHPQNENFVCTWFDHQVNLRKRRTFKSGKDFIVIPEVWALPMAKQCLEQKLDYAIFVQNGYLMNAGVNPDNYANLKEAYKNANLILSISDDTTQMIRTTYPNLKPTKILRLFPHLAKSFFPTKKEKIISYMPRKLSEHSRKIRFYLNEHLPIGWKLFPIDNLTESQVAEVLGKSSIFLSFCDQEGFALPPLEAALSGAMVIGYTGQGAKEYFNEPNFYEIQNGNFKSFVTAAIRAIQDVENGLLNSERFLAGIDNLRDSYDEKVELKHLLNFAQIVQQL